MNILDNTERNKYFNLFPQLETNRFYLKQLTDEYLTDLIEVMSDEETMKYSGMIIVNPTEQAQKILKKIENLYQSKQAIRWAIIHKKSKSYMGDIGFYNIDFYANHTELGYTVSKRYWREGIATECINRLEKFAFNELELNKITLMIDDKNYKSKNLAEKLNYKYDGILRDEFYRYDTNEYVSMLIFTKIKKDIF
jgi:ribosomal-protein-alanine N-acetyltransferase